MIYPRMDQEFVLPVLDRLIDNEPEEPSESRPRWIGAKRQIQDSVRANLHWILNSRRPLVELPPGKNHLQRSLLAYGLHDFTHVSISTAEERELLRGAIEAAIRHFEPRLIQVHVSRPESDSSGQNVLFKIEAVLNVKPAPERVTFDSVLMLPGRTFELRG
jgi:type VI secretion system protein ImpF